MHDNYKQAILKAKDTNVVVTGRIGGTPVRVLRNQMTKEYIAKEKEGWTVEQLEVFTLGSLRKAVFDGDVKTGSVMAGLTVGQLHEIRPLQDILDSLYNEYLAAKKHWAGFLLMSKCAVVTGGSRGIGKLIALRLAKDGFDIVVNYNSSSAAAEEVAQEIKAMGQECLVVLPM